MSFVSSDEIGEFITNSAINKALLLKQGATFKLEDLIDEYIWENTKPGLHQSWGTMFGNKINQKLFKRLPQSINTTAEYKRI